LYQIVILACQCPSSHFIYSHERATALGPHLTERGKGLQRRGRRGRTVALPASLLHSPCVARSQLPQQMNINHEIYLDEAVNLSTSRLIEARGEMVRCAMRNRGRRSSRSWVSIVPQTNVQHEEEKESIATPSAGLAKLVPKEEAKERSVGWTIGHTAVFGRPFRSSDIFLGHPV
jgi:hypothetical protein